MRRMGRGSCGGGSSVFRHNSTHVPLSVRGHLRGTNNTLPLAKVIVLCLSTDQRNLMKAKQCPVAGPRGKPRVRRPYFTGVSPIPTVHTLLRLPSCYIVGRQKLFCGVINRWRGGVC